MVEGSCDSRFAAVRAEFERNLAEPGELGASVCVTVDGETVVDLWGGVADAATQRPWASDTLVLVWSAADLDAVLLAPSRFALGFCKSVGDFGPSDVLVLGPAAFGHPGSGGSLGFADPDERLSFGYAMSKMGSAPG